MPRANLTEILKNFYYGKTENSGSFRGPAALHKAVRDAGYTDVTLKECKSFLSGQDTYTLYRPARKNFARNKISVEEVRELVQYDIMEIPDYADENNGYSYTLICQDTWSRFTYAVPMKTKSADAVAEALNIIFESGYVPQNAYSDNDKAFLSRKVKNLMKKYDINTYTTTSKVKAPHVERWIRSARTAIQRYFYTHNTHDWVKALTSFVHQYNRRKHSTHKQRPIDVLTNSEADWAAWLIVYGKKRTDRDEGLASRFSFRKTARAPKSKWRTVPKVGDYVQLSRIRGIFEKESNEQGAWTEEVFKIVRIKTTNDNETMYELMDMKNNKLAGLAYEEEIQVIQYNPAGLFIVEKFLRKCKIRGRLQYLIKWRGYSNDFNSYVDAQDVENLAWNQ